MGLATQELNKGMTLEDDINEMCPHFTRMDKLFREKPNVQPAGTLELGAVSTTRTDSPERSAEMEAAGDTKAADRSL
ncbi:hypothetical protein DVH05_008788 [Phytophthora capsici]|nr:hypothetical protein DVH05_008788 [Phytophthora capsici]